MFKRIGEATGLSRGGGAGTGAASPGSPLELIRYNQTTSKFELGEEALAVLRKVEPPRVMPRLDGGTQRCGPGAANVQFVPLCPEAAELKPLADQHWCTAHAAAEVSKNQAWCAGWCRCGARWVSLRCVGARARASPSYSISCWAAPLASRSLPPCVPVPKVGARVHRFVAHPCSGVSAHPCSTFGICGTCRRVGPGV